MAEAILFRFDAAMASFGGLAVGEMRPTDRRPAHSAIVGLIAGSLGLEREALLLHEELAAGFWLATRCDDIGAPLTDYHTAQTAPQKRGRFSTRAKELSLPSHELGTVQSWRDYWTDAAFTVLLWPTPEANHSPHTIAAALNRPRFVPFMGRKCCPLTRPVAARVIEADTVSGAFTAYDAAVQDGRLAGTHFACDAALAPLLGDMTETRRETRRDALLSRARWQFGLRTEFLATLNSGV